VTSAKINRWSGVMQYKGIQYQVVRKSVRAVGSGLCRWIGEGHAWVRRIRGLWLLRFDFTSTSSALLIAGFPSVQILRCPFGEILLGAGPGPVAHDPVDQYRAKEKGADPPESDRHHGSVLNRQSLRKEINWRQDGGDEHQSKRRPEGSAGPSCGWNDRHVILIQIENDQSRQPQIVPSINPTRARRGSCRHM
jgi:hypothetical protein